MMNSLYLEHPRAVLVAVVGILILFTYLPTFDSHVPHSSLASNGSDVAASCPDDEGRTWNPADRRSSETCTSIYWCVRTRGFNLNRIGNVEAKLATLFAPFIMNASCGSPNTVPFIVDIGVNDGQDVPVWFKLFLRQYSTTHFLLIEPQTQYIAQITTVVEKFTSAGDADRIHIVNAAIGEQHNNTVTLRGEGVLASLVGGAGKVRTVREVRLDALIRQFVNTSKWRIPFLKIDCEGYDPVILMALRDLFQQKLVDFVVYELNNMYDATRDALHGRMSSPRTSSHQNYVAAAAMLLKHGYGLFLVGIDPENVLGQPNLIFIEVGSVAQAETWPGYLETFIAVRDKGLVGRMGDLVGQADTHRYVISLSRWHVGCGKLLRGNGPLIQQTCFPRIFRVNCSFCGIPRNKGSSIHSTAHMIEG